VVTCEEGPRYLSFRISPLQGDAGEHLGTVIIVDDVTQQKSQAEQTQRAKWLSAMGEMADSIAQAVRNPLGSMELFASLLKQELAGDAERVVMAEHILSGVKSLNQNISNLLLYTKCPIPRLATVDPHQLLEDSLVFASHLVRHHHLRLYKHFATKGMTIHADTELLKQVFLNLILNAIQAMPNGGALTLATRSYGNVFELQISDTGVGMSSQVSEKIFNPFFTTKERSTGLGLTMVHNAVQAHKGTIHVVSTEGKGSTFILALPLGSMPPEGAVTETCTAIPRVELPQEVNRSLEEMEK
jgi:signal transduction histidine kinase